MKRTLGTCYYPEHWPESQWAQDARRMADLGLTWVRIGEFAWSRLEPAPGDLRLDWLDRAIAVLGGAGLKVVLGTPTATPPRWMLDKHPDMLGVDAGGQARKFGSRRHYCFSHPGYRAEAARITRLLAERYGPNPHVAAWQTDNEYGCHDTTLSYSEAARAGFQDWCRQRYGNVQALNAAWGNVFWSMEYQDFAQIDLPNLTVTEPNPAHALAFRRFSSDQVAAFNAAQVEIIRSHSDAPISHNFMGRITDFDHFALGRQMEIAAWDSYPLGFLEDRVPASPAHRRQFARQGDPDFQAFHHDLYRAVGRGRWWVMEQQPGPVNWAPYNPAPLPGMIRLWTWEAFAHGAEAVCYFRWRQAPFGQEQMHAGLFRPDDEPAQAFHEATQVMHELRDLPQVAQGQAPVALVFDYAAVWAIAVQPQGQGQDCFQQVFGTYRALRRMGLSVDILPPDCADLGGYKAVFAPGAVTLTEPFKAAIGHASGIVVLGPRSNSRTAEMAIPVPLPPAIPGLDVTVSRVESLRPDLTIPVEGGGAVVDWIEDLEGSADVVLRTEGGQRLAMAQGTVIYLGAGLDDMALERFLRGVLSDAGVTCRSMPGVLRSRVAGDTEFLINYDAAPVRFDGLTVPAAGVVWRKGA